MFAVGLMGNDDNQDRGRAVRDRIANFFQANEDDQRKRATNEELQRLEHAVGRLEQLLTDAAPEEQTQCNPVTQEETQALQSAATRLDQLLANISGKQGTSGSKVRHRRNQGKAE